MWKVPLFKVDLDKPEIKAIEDVIQSGWLTMGKVTEDFEEQFREFIGVKHAIAVSSCTAALHLANHALGIRSEDEVICSSLTFVAGANSILYVGAKPVFADINSLEDFTISLVDIEKKITKRVKAIQVVHYAGYACDMRPILKIAKQHNLKVIEDCAHALGAVYDNRKCGSIGDIGCFSFYANKNMTTAEGGMITTNDDALAQKLKLMRSHGMTNLAFARHKEPSLTYDVVELGYNYRIDEIRSAIGMVQLDKLTDNNKRREDITNLYRLRLKNVSGLSIPFENHRGISSYHIFPILLDKEADRPRFMEYLKEQGIQTSIHYPAIHQFSFYKKSVLGNNISLPLTEEVTKREVTLPLYPAMNESDVGYVCDTISNFLN